MFLSTASRIGLGILLAATAARAESTAFDWPADVAWRAEFVGVESAAITLTEPRPLRLHASRIDTQADGVSFCTNDGNGDRPLETDGCFTTTFLRRKRCQIAINGAPFGPGRANEGETQNVAGLLVSDGEVISPPETAGEPTRSALVFRDDGPEIELPPVSVEGVHTAIGGFGVVLRGGEPYHDETTPEGVLNGIHPRTAVGLADDGETLLLLVVDGRQPGYSEGVTLGELGELLRLFGAHDAVNLDGGGTSTMVIESAAGLPTLVNRPIDGRVPGQQRVAANHLGVHAKRLPEPAVQAAQ
ncbi:MAG: phosphodiester glycosidase family protein [Planctomycetota bacterium]